MLPIVQAREHLALAHIPYQKLCNKGRLLFVSRLLGVVYAAGSKKKQKKTY